MRVELDVVRDTSFDVRMGVDSVFLRMVEMKVRQLKKRADASPVRVVSVNRDAITREGTMLLGDLISRRTFTPLPRPGLPIAGCEIVDEVRAVPGMIVQMLPELVERVEIYGSPRGPSMIRVYTKRYVASLLGKETVPGVLFRGQGVAPVGCSP